MKMCKSVFLDPYQIIGLPVFRILKWMDTLVIVSPPKGCLEVLTGVYYLATYSQ